MLVKLTEYYSSKPRVVNLDNILYIDPIYMGRSNEVLGSQLVFIEGKSTLVKESIDDILMFDNFRIKPDQ